MFDDIATGIPGVGEARRIVIAYDAHVLFIDTQHGQRAQVPGIGTIGEKPGQNETELLAFARRKAIHQTERSRRKASRPLRHPQDR